MITGLAHLCFRVRDLDAQIAFYTEKLGMTEAFDFVNDDGERFGVYLHIGRRNFIEMFRAEQAPPAGGCYQHVCLEVDDIGRTAEELRSRGVEVTEPKLGSDGAWQAWVGDPEGNRIELHQYLPDSRQSAWLSE